MASAASGEEMPAGSTTAVIPAASMPWNAAVAILCDLDGTLLDTVPDIADAVDEVLRALGRAAPDERVVRDYVGQGVDVLLHRALGGGIDARAEPRLHARARALFDAAYAATNGRRTRLYAGVVEGLDALRARGLRLACVTNKPQAPSDALLAQFGLDAYFDFALGGDALPQRKPQPEPLWHAAGRLGVPAAACVMLGDSANDALAARAAGMPVALVDYGYTEGRPLAEIDCDLVVPSVAAFAGRLGRNAEAALG